MKRQRIPLEHALAVKALADAIELVDDLRCYTHDWDWKYGEDWDAARVKLSEALAKANVREAGGEVKS